MGAKTHIGWADATWNPWQGCRKVSVGCANCYMYREKKRYGQDPVTVVRSKTTFKAPLKKNRKGEFKIPSGQKVFVCSWSDFFIADADEWRAEAWKIIKQRPDLIFMILTKRPENIKSRLPADWGEGYPNVWLGVTAENQEMANYRIPILLNTPAAVRFVSCEPLLDTVRLHMVHAPDWDWNVLNGDYGPTIPLSRKSELKLDWVIIGGESGPHARAMDDEDAELMLYHCVTYKVPVFFKQWGSHIPEGTDNETFFGQRYNDFPRLKL